MTAKNRDYIGLDIGSYSIKLVQLERSNKGLKLLRFAVKKMPRDIMKGGRIDSPHQLSEQIRDIVLEQKLSGTMAGAALSGAAAEVAVVDVPAMGDDEFRESASWHYRQRFPFGTEEAACDYQILDDMEGAPQDKKSVLLAGARRTDVEQYREIMENTGLSLSDLNVCPLAVVDAFIYNYSPEKYSGLLVHAGAEVTEVVLMQNGALRFTRAVIMGGNGITSTIADGLDLDFDQAEVFKEGGAAPGDLGKEVARYAEKGAEELVSGIREAMEDYKSLVGSGSMEKVMLSGGGSKLSAFSRQLKKQLSVQTEYINPFKKIIQNKFNPKYITHYISEAAPAVGLALRGGLGI